MVIDVKQGDLVCTNQDIIYPAGVVPSETVGVVSAVADNFLIINFEQPYCKKFVHISEVYKIGEVYKKGEVG